MALRAIVAALKAGHLVRNHTLKEGEVALVYNLLERKVKAEIAAHRGSKEHPPSVGTGEHNSLIVGTQEEIDMTIKALGLIRPNIEGA